MTTHIRRPQTRALLFFMLAGLLFAACGDLVENANWPGLSARGSVVYVAYGPAVAAFDLDSRAELWSYPLEPAAGRSFFASPSVADNRVIIGDYGVSGGFLSPAVKVSLLALDTSGDGPPRELWINDELARDRIVAPPLQVGETVYVGTADNLLLALNAGSGRELWRFETGHSIWAQPLLQDEILYVVSLDKRLYAISREDGALQWQVEFGGAIINQPVLGEGMLYAGSFDNKLHAVDLSTGTEAWSVDAGGWIWAGPALAGDRVFFADLDGMLYAVDAGTGNPAWTVDGTALGLVQATPIIYEDLIIFAGADVESEEEQLGGTLLAVRQDTGAEVWRQRTPAPVYASPILVDDRLVVAVSSAQGLLFVYDAATGQPDGAPVAPAASQG